MTKPWKTEGGELIAGIYEGISDAAYQRIDALRASTMKEALQSAKQLRYRMNNKRPDTGALRMGRAVHLAVLQPDVYPTETMCVPDEYVTGSGAMSTGKKAREWLAALSSDVTALTAEEDNTAMAMASAVFEHSAADQLLQSAPGREVTALWEEVTPQGARVWCKARADAIGGGVLLDLKSTRETHKFNVRGVGGVIANFGYHFQLAWYSRGFESAAEQSGVADGHEYYMLSWGFIFVQSVAPHDVIACTADDELQDIGRMEAETVWQTYAEAVDANCWPGVAPELVEVSLPRWAVPRDDDDTESLGLTGVEVMR